jgi:ABC-2 type transport system ATP-binding protein
LSDHVIEITGLSKYYGNKCALKDVNLTVDSHEVVGLLGPNGSGKTTLIKLMCSLLLPSKGTIVINGKNTAHDSSHREKLAYMAENAGYYENCTAYSYLKLFCTYLSVDNHRERCRTSLESVNLLDSADKKISTFSKGMKQRLGIARCLLNDPDIMLLDEPLTALDPSGKKEIIQILEGLRDAGKTVVLSSHELRYMDNMCDRICIIRSGNILKIGTPNSIMSQMANYNDYQIELKSLNVNIESLKQAFPEIIAINMVQNVLNIRVSNNEGFERRLLKYLLDNGIDFSVQTNKLDMIYSNYFDEGFC